MSLSGFFGFLIKRMLLLPLMIINLMQISLNSSTFGILLPERLRAAVRGIVAFFRISIRLLQSKRSVSVTSIGSLF